VCGGFRKRSCSSKKLEWDDDSRVYATAFGAGAEAYPAISARWRRWEESSRSKDCGPTGRRCGPAPSTCCGGSRTCSLRARPRRRAPSGDQAHAKQIAHEPQPAIGAKTRSGSQCRSPAMPNSHAGCTADHRRGTPKAKQNAFKHGRYTAEAMARRRELSALLQAMRTLAGRRGSLRTSPRLMKVRSFRIGDLSVGPVLCACTSGSVVRLLSAPAAPPRPLECVVT